MTYPAACKAEGVHWQLLSWVCRTHSWWVFCYVTGTRYDERKNLLLVLHRLGWAIEMLSSKVKISAIHKTKRRLPYTGTQYLHPTLRIPQATFVWTSFPNDWAKAASKESVVRAWSAHTPTGISLQQLYSEPVLAGSARIFWGGVVILLQLDALSGFRLSLLTRAGALQGQASVTNAPKVAALLLRELNIDATVTAGICTSLWMLH